MSKETHDPTGVPRPLSESPTNKVGSGKQEAPPSPTRDGLPSVAERRSSETLADDNIVETTSTPSTTKLAPHITAGGAQQPALTTAEELPSDIHDTPLPVVSPPPPSSPPSPSLRATEHRSLPQSLKPQSAGPEPRPPSPPPQQRPAAPARGLSAAFEKACTINEVELAALDAASGSDDSDSASASYSDSMSSSSQAPESWISAFCSLVGHEYFAEVSEDFIEDDFNLTGLQNQVPMYKEALEMILDVEPEEGSDEEEEEEEEEDEDDEDMQGQAGADGAGRGYRRGDAAERRHLRMASDLSVIESSAEMLYGLIHQRFITSRPGVQQMAEKYELGHFGHCPRVYCHGAKVLPVGCSDIPGQETVKLFCPSCLDVYSPPNSRFQTVDGAFFGTTFGCLFFMTFPELDVGGTRPPDVTPATTTSPQASSSNAAANQHSRTSLSSSLTSQQGGRANAPGQAAIPLPPQPDSINGVAPRNLAPGLGPGSIYEPRIYGFRVSELARTGPRMKWLRGRPLDVNELDECRIWVQNQAANQSGAAGAPTTEAELGDSEMIDDNAEADEGEVEDEDMEANGGGPPDGIAPDGSQAHAQDVASRTKSSRKQRQQAAQPHHESLPNGSNGGTVLSVGGAG